MLLAATQTFMVKRDTYHHGDLRQALIDAAVAVIGESDVRSLSLRQLARRVGVSHAAPYRHFEDKDALLAVVAEEGFRLFTRYLKQAVATTTDPRAQLVATGQAYLRFALDRPTHLQVMFGGFAAEPRYESLMQVADGAFQVLVGVIERGQQQGVFRPEDTRLMALCAWSQVHGLAQLQLAGQLMPRSPEQVAELTAALSSLLLKGFAVDAAAVSSQPLPGLSSAPGCVG